MEKRIQGLPPVKRFKYLQKENQKPDPTVDQLPAKKRKFPFCPNFTTSYCLPAKKRIWAPPVFQSDSSPQKPLSSFDLNIEYSPFLDPEIEQIKTLDHKDDGDDDDDEDGILCAVCESSDGDESDPIVFCDGCDLTVHKNCYGNPLTTAIPDGDWFCAKCLATKESANPDSLFQCCLCPVVGGALKPTSDNRWAHVVCAVYVPEVFFKDPEGRDGIDCSRVPLTRWEKKCYLCGCKDGCAIECTERKCELGFHVTCGLKEDLCIEYIQGKKKNEVIVAGFCKNHTALWAKQQKSGKFKIVAKDMQKKS